ncbi:helix-turn-helix domain-containing protein [Snuella sedimenti]|uniref:helix-turn-helix domain-containing protein n=1 Tax=Snuella sedimenti TaxID=2798802 RepID=UPI001E539CA8|nr:helix-turn-helix transcriptional regulator [Snuella sedimenti]
MFLIFFTLISFVARAQYSFSGHVDNRQWHNNVYLSIIKDYRQVSGIYFEQIIAKVTTDSLGYFEFTGDQLETKNRIYRIHVDNCFEEDQNHFDGHCDNSKAVIFIAKNNDSIQFPFSFNQQMFCDIKSTNEKSTAFIKIDSLKEEMKFAFSEFRSEANRKLNNKKWFKTLQDYGEQLNEPLAELYIYSFLSDRRNDFHEHYLEDLKKNVYYDNLLDHLNRHYPNSSYTKQYNAELNSDKFIISSANPSYFNWNYLIYLVLFTSITANFWLWQSRKKIQNNNITTGKKQLTKQEQNILNLLLEEKTNKEIADTLFVSLSTVKTHVNNIYKKLDVQSRSEIKSLFNG